MSAHEIPLTRDTELARSLGYSRRSNIRRLIANMIDEGALAPADYVLSAENGSPRGAYYLTAHGIEAVTKRSRAHLRRAEPPPIPAATLAVPTPQVGLDAQALKELIEATIQSTVKATLAALAPHLASRPAPLALPSPSPAPRPQAEILPFPELISARLIRERWSFLPEAARRIGITVQQLCDLISALRMWGSPDIRRQETSTGRFARQLSEYALEIILKEAYARRLTRSLTLRGAK